jgi:hypothetical protein
MQAMGPVKTTTTVDGDSSRAAVAEPPGEAPQSRALVALDPPRSAPARPQRASAGFLAQLIATERRLPQTCARRRSEPADAAASYLAAGQPAPKPAGRRVSRSS